MIFFFNLKNQHFSFFVNSTYKKFVKYKDLVKYISKYKYIYKSLEVFKMLQLVININHFKCVVSTYL